MVAAVYPWRWVNCDCSHLEIANITFDCLEWLNQLNRNSFIPSARVHTEHTHKHPQIQWKLTYVIVARYLFACYSISSCRIRCPWEIKLLLVVVVLLMRSSAWQVAGMHNNDTHTTEPMSAICVHPNVSHDKLARAERERGKEKTEWNGKYSMIKSHSHKSV